MKGPHPINGEMLGTRLTTNTTTILRERDNFYI